MKQLFVLAATALTLSQGVQAQTPADSTRLVDLSEAVVKSVKAQKNAPYAVSNISKQQLEQFSTSGQELPFLFARTPGVVAWSENGVGTGTTYMRIRGAADSRINVTLDGVALNSPEDQCVFWANMNSYASLLGGVQIQRGVGTSTNGDGAFGGSIMLQSKVPSYKPMLELTGSYGSYNTWRAGGKFSSGLLWNHLIIDGAYHHTGTDGYIHGTDGNSGSYYGGLTFINTPGNLKLSYKHFGNYEKTGQAWNGLGKSEMDAGEYRYNSLYEYWNNEDDYTQGTSRYQMKDGSLWPRTTDNFWQNHNLLNLSWQINERWSTSATAHYTSGHGYYDEFRPENKLKKFGLASFVGSDGNEVSKTDFVRQKGLHQNVGGLVWNFNYQHQKWDVVFGGAAQMFWGDHYGYLTYTKNDDLRALLLASPAQVGGAAAPLKYQYYDSDARKQDENIFAKMTYHISSCWDMLLDFQYRHVGYKTDGVNDKFYKQADGTYANQVLNINKKYDFFNPKMGFTYHKNGHTAFLSFARSNREPERNNFTDNGAYPAPAHETLNDLELGYNYRGTNWNVGANGYWMYYHNQFVQTGAYSDIGEYLTTNVKESYRLGLELTAAYRPTSWLTIEANAAVSQNRILNFDEQVETYAGAWWDDAPATPVHYDHSTLAFSPTAIVNGFLDFHHKGFSALWHTNYVSRQYLDNTQNKERSLKGFTTSNLHLGYDLRIADKGLKHIIFGVNLNNLFNAHYAVNGGTYSCINPDDGCTLDARSVSNWYYPMSGFTAMGSVTLKF